MFSGIVSGYDRIVDIEVIDRVYRFTVELSNRKGLEQGASVAVNGVCLSVVSWDDKGVVFDAIEETLRLTNLGSLKIDDRVNTERSFKMGQELGGHVVSGHVDASVEVLRVDQQQNAVKVWYAMSEPLKKYLFVKGFVALDGCSLTLVDVEDDRFSVAYIPDTLTKTTHGALEVGRLTNIEIDRQTQAIVNTVERVLAARELVG
ncbi:riboflavin synthase subunit alpha [Umboniibacter marinipuniceus]|uniref:Riboflavin synthase n=1 Tax=Umboniibacter marinipuniceus TaxID=569599 RepID=A0A3M0A9P8_9GAMM|nr:riboflavin synthase subunit alpha [Umboniibacter marinipuniceus]RMA81346.1 riboflavin synthase alpha chain [Umboniibacter marinipuniceus]